MGNSKHLTRMAVLLGAVLLFTGLAHCRRTVYHYRFFPPSRQSLLDQNAEIDRLGLPRYQNEKELSAAIERGDLIQIGSGPVLMVDSHLPADRRYCRAWTHDFIMRMAFAYWLRFNRPLVLTSAVRTVQVQSKLRRWNHNAAPAHGDVASSHLSGLTVDIGRRGLTAKQNNWIEWYLKDRGTAVIVEEEDHQRCFHICVRKPL